HTRRSSDLRTRPRRGRTRPRPRVLTPGSGRRQPATPRTLQQTDHAPVTRAQQDHDDHTSLAIPTYTATHGQRAETTMARPSAPTCQRTHVTAPNPRGTGCIATLGAS